MTLLRVTDAKGFITLHEPDEDGNPGDLVASVWRDDWLDRLTATPPASDAAVPAGERTDADLLRLIAKDHERLAPNAYHSADTLRQIADRIAAAPKVASDTGAITPEWCLRMAELEAGQEIGAGALDHPLRTKCELPPAGRVCIRTPGHDGPCAAVASDTGAGLREALARAAVDLQLCPRHNRDGAADRHIQESRDRIRTAMLLATPTDATDGATGGGDDKVTDAHLNATTPGGGLLEQAITIVNEEGPQNPESDWTDYACARATMRDNILKRLLALKPAGDGGEA